MAYESLQGKVIAVSGGASGIGLAVVKKLLLNGAKVAIADLAPEPVAELAELAGPGVEFIYTTADMSKRDLVHQWIQAIVEKFGRLDGMVPNHGIAPDEVNDTNNNIFDRVIAVNLTGVYNCGIEAYLQFRKQQSKGVICVTTSTQGLRGARGVPAYTAAKHGVVGLVRAWSVDWAGEGIRVNAVAPGLTSTPLQRNKSESLLAQFRTRIPLLREGQSEELADSYLFLLADTSSYITGHTLVCDGGLIV